MSEQKSQTAQAPANSNKVEDAWYSFSVNQYIKVRVLSLNDQGALSIARQLSSFFIFCLV